MLSTRVDSRTAALLLTGAIALSALGISAAYYLYEGRYQICEEYATAEDADIFINENGDYCKFFDAGDHVIRISRNDAYFHDYGTVDGYMIQSAQIRGWRDNSKVEYVNIEPVEAIGRMDAEGHIIFDQFGTVKGKTLR